MLKLTALVLLLAIASPTWAANPLVASTQPRSAPEFELIDTQGDKHTLAAYQGKVLIVNFWATWCPPCIKEMPSLQRAADALRADGVQVLGINVGESKEDIESFMDITPVDFPLLLDENMEQGPLWSLRGLPTTLIVDSKGNIIYTVLGEREWDDPVIVDQIRTLAQP